MKTCFKIKPALQYITHRISCCSLPDYSLVFNSFPVKIPAYHEPQTFWIARIFWNRRWFWVLNLQDTKLPHIHSQGTTIFLLNHSWLAWLLLKRWTARTEIVEGNLSASININLLSILHRPCLFQDTFPPYIAFLASHLLPQATDPATWPRGFLKWVGFLLKMQVTGNATAYGEVLEREWELRPEAEVLLDYHILLHLPTSIY